MLNRILIEILQVLELKPDLWAVRYNTTWNYSRQENNIFSLASALFILQEIRPLLSKEQQRTIDNIEEIIVAKYPAYKNKDGRETYNFYRTVPSRHFPNGFFMQHFEHFRLPDDIDDTALIYKTTKVPKVSVEKLKFFAESFAQEFSDGKRIYNTWYGKNMPKEQDVCAILNLLYVFYSQNLPLNKTDKESFNFLKDSILKIESHPFEIARHYVHPALIVYHYSRFMSKFSSPLDNSKEEIIKMAYRLLEKETVFMNKLILSSSLLKLGESPTALNLSELNFDNFYTFIGAPFAPFSNYLFRHLAKKPAFQIFWKSDIHTKALLAEYLVLSNKKT